MTERWEYMSLVWHYSTQKKSAPDKNEWEWRAEFFIVRGGEEPEQRLQYDYGEQDRRTTNLELLNELGAEGWELVSETTLANAVVSGSNGWSDCSCPIEIRWTLKRRLPAA